MFAFDGIGAVAVVAIGVLSLGIYLLPSLIAFNRGVQNRWLILVINVFLGASLIGWLVGLYMATRKAEASQAQPV